MKVSRKVVVLKIKNVHQQNGYFERPRAVVFNLFYKISPLHKCYLEIAPLPVVFALSENIILFSK